MGQPRGAVPVRQELRRRARRRAEGDAAAAAASPRRGTTSARRYRGKQQYAEAENAYKRATQLDPNYADAYFNLGILYLDAKQMPGTDLITKLNTSINYLNKYKQLAGYRLTKDDPADTYIAEARTGIDREQKRL